MGIIYKLNQKTKNLVLEEKKNNPQLSCRKLAKLIEHKHSLKLSKSSINSIFKESGLSFPVGRRSRIQKPKEEVVLPLPEVVVETPSPVLGLPIIQPAIQVVPETPPPAPEETLGAVFLRAADFLIGGSTAFKELTKERIASASSELILASEYLLYQSLSPDLWLPALIGQRVLPDKLPTYLLDIQRVTELKTDLCKVIVNRSQEARGIILHLSGAGPLYLDGQLHTIWSSPHIPLDFSTTLYNAKSCINSAFKENAPLVLMKLIGEDYPSEDFFNLVLGLESQKETVANVAFYGSDLERLQEINYQLDKERGVVFGLWPAQFSQYRKVHRIGEFKPFYFKGIDKEYYLAEIEMDISQPSINKTLTLRGAALKLRLDEKVKLAILTNLAQDKLSLERLSGLYLSRWPNLDEGLNDFQRKTELFSYTLDSQKVSPTQHLAGYREFIPDISFFFKEYIKALDAYSKKYFFPAGYEDKDFPTMNKYFYSLKAIAHRQDNCLQIALKPPPDYPLLKDLEYACRRVNERAINLGQDTQLWLRVV